MTTFFSNNLISLRKNKGITQTDAAIALGLKRNTISNYETGHSEPDIDTILRIASYFDISTDNLLKTDVSKLDLSQKSEQTEVAQKLDLKPDLKPDLFVKKQENQVKQEYPSPSSVFVMPKVTTVDSAGDDNMVLVTVKARAGYLSGYGDPAHVGKLEAFKIPGFRVGCFRMFEVEGLSMHPTFNDGDILITRSLETLADIREDRIHVVVTRNDGIVVKRVLNRVQTDGKLILKSDNKKDKAQYPNLVISPDDILEIWYTIGYMSRIMPQPTAMYEKMLDIEARLTLLEHSTKKKPSEES